MENLTSEKEEIAEKNNFESGVSFEQFMARQTRKRSQMNFDEEKVFDYRKRVSKNKSSLHNSNQNIDSLFNDQPCTLAVNKNQIIDSRTHIINQS